MIKNKFARAYGALQVSFAIAILYIILDFAGIGCPVKFLTGISCAGCGMTRAWICVLHLKFKQAFYYHPLFWTVPIYLILFTNRKKISKRKFGCAITIGIGMFLAVYMFRLFNNPDGTVININIKHGLIFKIIHYIRGDDY